jgi:cholesterol transport system auxiliary component
MKQVYLFIAVMLFTTACATRTYAPYSEYALQTTTPKQQSKQVCVHKSVRVAKALVPQILMHKKMYYVKGLESYTYSQSRWAQRPVSLITQAILQSLQNSNIFATVVSADSKAKTAYVLESRVDSFIQYYDVKKQNSHARVAISFFLIDTKSARVLKHMHFEKELRSQSRDAKGGVRALNQLLSDAVYALVVWLKAEECR